MSSNRETLLAYAGTAVGNERLVERLPTIVTPRLVTWGIADRMVLIAHAHQFAAAIPHAELDLIDTAGHLPQLETPQRLVQAVWAFADERAATHSS
jgi:pimeloyl-ACP methyl ester carboxylesterase